MRQRLIIALSPFAGLMLAVVCVGPVVFGDSSSPIERIFLWGATAALYAFMGFVLGVVSDGPLPFWGVTLPGILFGLWLAWGDSMAQTVPALALVFLVTGLAWHGGRRAQRNVEAGSLE